MTSRLAAGVAAALIAASFALPALAAPSGTNITLVNGNGWRLSPADGTPRVQFSVEAWMAPGGYVNGSYHYGNVAGTELKASVTCADAAGNLGVVGGTIVDGTELVGLDYFVVFVDHGAAQFGSIGPDVLSQTFVDPQGGEEIVELPDAFPAECPTAGDIDLGALPAGAFAMVGDVVVHAGN